MYVCIIEIFIFYIYSKNVYLSKDLVKKKKMESSQRRTQKMNSVKFVNMCICIHTLITFKQIIYKVIFQ